MTFIALMALHAAVLAALYFAIHRLTPDQQDRLIALQRFGSR
jgi:multisubunit Na+/H+ antiporter MnhF subunit